MEQNVQIPQPMPVTEQIGFPNPNMSEKKSNGMVKWIIVVLGVIAIVAAGIFFIMRTSTESDTATATPTPAIDDRLTAVATPEPTATPAPTPSAAPVDRSEIKVEVLNGTGTAGDAGLVKSSLEDLEITDITVGNADEQEETETTVTYSDKLDMALIDEIVAELEGTFSEVKTRKGTIAGDFDIRIVTGEKK